jgi:hypothetical protein
LIVDIAGEPFFWQISAFDSYTRKEELRGYEQGSSARSIWRQIFQKGKEANSAIKFETGVSNAFSENGGHLNLYGYI